MKSHIRIIAGLMCVALAMSLIIFKKNDKEIQTQLQPNKKITEVVLLKQESASDDIQKEFKYQLEINPTFPE
jgi:hypothetical protein